MLPYDVLAKILVTTVNVNDLTFIKTAAKILQKIQKGVFDVSDEPLRIILQSSGIKVAMAVRKVQQGQEMELLPKEVDAAAHNNIYASHFVLLGYSLMDRLALNAHGIFGMKCIDQILTVQ
ncbi:hypothetical protein ACH5RR_026237 [Cinchona calisaya]|uniref:Uncharacterized protein n=1 Tax=Cinchona calisaya TaxID=153742 RepID=A0ABD2Z5B5_9GENT